MVDSKRERCRVLTAGDGQGVCDILEASRAASQVPIGPDWTSDQIKSECKEASGLVMESETGRLEAFVLFRDVGVAWEISFLAVDPELRGQGRMRTLLRLLQERLREIICQKPQGWAIWLEVHEANQPALNLYARVGFQEVGRRPRYYSDGGAAILFSYG